jgi:hypothetical protein
MHAVAQVSAARVVIDHTVQQVTGHQGAQDRPVVSSGDWQQQHSSILELPLAAAAAAPLTNAFGMLAVTACCSAGHASSL